MKKIILLLVVFASSFVTRAQDSTSSDPKIMLKLTKIHFGYIWRTMTPAERGSIDGFQLLNQLLPQIADTTSAELATQGEVIIRKEFLMQTFRRLGDLPERLMAIPNGDMKKELLPQLQNHPDLLKLVAVALKSSAEESKRNAVYGIQEILNAKQ